MRSSVRVRFVTPLDRQPGASQDGDDRVAVLVAHRLLPVQARAPRDEDAERYRDEVAAWTTSGFPANVVISGLRALLEMLIGTHRDDDGGYPMSYGRDSQGFADCIGEAMQDMRAAAAVDP